MKYVFVVNPLAGDENTEYLIRREIENLEEKDDCEVYVTKAPKDATSFVRNWVKEHPGEKVRFIACGGDGTINEVFNGAVGLENVDVTVYPCGSGNDFVKAYGGADKFTDLQALIKAGTRKLDLLKVGDLYSNNVVNFGFDTYVAITVNEDRAKKGHGSKSSYTKGIIKSLITKMRNRFKVTADGKLLNPDGVALLCTLSNGQYVGGSFNCAPKARMDDGLIDVCLVKPISRIRFVTLLKPYTEGTFLDDPKFDKILTYCQAKKVEVEAPEGFAYSLDGEIIYQNKFTVEIVPGALDLAVPD